VTPLLSAFAVLLPVTALLGVAQAVREISVLAQDPAWAAGAAARGHFKDIAVNRQSASLEQMTYWIYAAMVALVFVARGARWLLERRRGTVRITYPSGMVVRVPRGLAVLDASRRASIPHASICGGRGRCSTCRVRVLRGIDGLPAPWPHEAAVLARFGSSRNVRLACQTRPTKDITILPLLPPDVSPDDLRRRTAGTASAERFVAIMFIDIRESTALVETRLPYDVIFLLNHFFEAVGGAVAVYGGSPNQFLGDGMMAIFGMECEPMEACRQVLAATSMIYRKLEEMNHLLADDLPRPIRIGIGVHAGTVILGEIGYRERFLLTAIGDPVHVAARLQELSKEYRCQMVVSEVVRATADLPHAGIAHYGVRVRGRELPLDVWAIDDATQFSMISP